MWKDIFDLTYAAAGNFHTWDYQWMWALWAQNGLVIVPTLNLVTNIGFGEDAAHPFSLQDYESSALLPALPSEEMNFPLRCPPFMVRDRKYDYFALEKIANDIAGRKRHPGVIQKVRWKLDKIILRKILSLKQLI